MSNNIPKAIIENGDGTKEVLEEKVDTGLRGDFTKVVKTYTSPIPIRTFEAIEINDELVKTIKGQGVEYAPGFFSLETYNDSITIQTLEYNVQDKDILLCSKQREETDQYLVNNEVSLKLTKGQVLARYEGILNVVESVIPYTDEIDKLNKLINKK